MQSRRLGWWWAAARRRPGLAVLFVGQAFGVSLVMSWLQPGEVVRNVVKVLGAIVMPLTLVGWRMRIARVLEQDDEVAERRQSRPPAAIGDVERYAATLRHSVKQTMAPTTIGAMTSIGVGGLGVALWMPGLAASDRWTVVGVFVVPVFMVIGPVIRGLRLARRRMNAGHPVPARVLGFVPADQYVVVESLDGERRVVLMVQGRHALVAGDEVAMLGELAPVDMWFGKASNCPMR